MTPQSLETTPELLLTLDLDRVDRPLEPEPPPLPILDQDSIAAAVVDREGRVHAATPA